MNIVNDDGLLMEDEKIAFLYLCFRVSANKRPLFEPLFTLVLFS